MRKNELLYRSGTDTINPTEPGGIERLLEFHRVTFGDARMETEAGTGTGAQNDGAGDGSNNQPGNAGQGGNNGGADGKFKDPDTGDTYDFPEKTPLKDMSADQQAEYWRHKARKHEARVTALGDVEQLRADAAELARLRREGMSENDKALADAREQAANEARTAERASFAEQLVTAEFRAANNGRIETDRMKGLLEGIDPHKFLTPEGQVDTDKVKQYVDGVAPADTKQKWPDMGQGRRGGGAAKSSGVAAGRALFEDRHSQKKS